MEWLYVIGEYSLALNFIKGSSSSTNNLNQSENTLRDGKYKHGRSLRYCLHAKFLAICALEKLHSFNQCLLEIESFQNILNMLPNPPKVFRKYQNRVQIKKLHF